MSERSKHEPPRSESSKERRKSFATIKDARSNRNYPIINVTKKSLMLCPYSEIGCDFYINKDNLEELIQHTRDKVEYHLQLTTDAYKKIKSDNEEIKKKYEKLKSDWNAYHMKLEGPHSSRKMSNENNLSPTYRRISLTPIPYSSERRPSGGRVSPFGRERDADALIAETVQNDKHPDKKSAVVAKSGIRELAMAGENEK